MLKIFLIFAFLQAADLGTTVAVLKLGGVEKNPLVHAFMALGPVAGLIVSKVLAVMIGVGLYLAAKSRALRLANLVFAGIVLWNVTIIARLV